MLREVKGQELKELLIDDLIIMANGSYGNLIDCVNEGMFKILVDDDHVEWLEQEYLNSDMPYEDVEPKKEESQKSPELSCQSKSVQVHAITRRRRRTRHRSGSKDDRVPEIDSTNIH